MLAEQYGGVSATLRQGALEGAHEQPIRAVHLAVSVRRARTRHRTPRRRRLDHEFLLRPRCGGPARRCDLMKALRLITPSRPERMLLIMDSVALATLVATVVAIYEAVLVALVARAGGARDTLMADVRGVRRLLTEQPLDPAALLLKGRDWEQYAGESRAQRKDLELRLKQLLHPDLVAMREREDAKEAEQREQIKTQDEKRRRALLRLADTVERFGEQDVKGRLAAAGWNGQKIDRYLQQARQVKSEASEIRNFWLERDPATSKYTLPAGDGDRGVVLLEVLAALACQPPMPRRVRESGDGTVASCDAQVPALASPDEAKSWATQVLDELRPAISLIADRDDQIDALIDAARAQRYLLQSENTAQSDDASIVVELERSEKRVRALSVEARPALRDTYVAAIGLQISEAEWNATRPSRKYRWALAAGLVIGAAVFVVGVVVPILAVGAPNWLTVDVPAYAFGMVAVSLLIVAFSYVLKL